MELVRLKAKLSKHWGLFKELKALKGEKHAKHNAKRLRAAATNVAKGEKIFLKAYMIEKKPEPQASFKAYADVLTKRGTLDKTNTARVAELLK